MAHPCLAGLRALWAMEGRCNGGGLSDSMSCARLIHTTTHALSFCFLTCRSDTSGPGLLTFWMRRSTHPQQCFKTSELPTGLVPATLVQRHLGRATLVTPSQPPSSGTCAHRPPPA
jgi:hypothetical protein